MKKFLCCLLLLPIFRAALSAQAPLFLEGFAAENAAADRDGDGLRNDIDKCPDTFGLAASDGCPSADRDGDGIKDETDKCPDVPGPAAEEGCPDADADGDGVADALDNCPYTPGPSSSGGCPVATASEKAILDLAIRNLFFDTGKPSIKPESFRFLDKLAELVARRKEWMVKVSGYPGAGPDEQNLDLSKRRAEAVLAYLASRGVGSSQLLMEYFGEFAPATSNPGKTPRYLNRQVDMEFVWD